MEVKVDIMKIQEAKSVALMIIVIIKLRTIIEIKINIETIMILEVIKIQTMATQSGKVMTPKEII